jgi:Na+/H+ antiporter NhaD/arsenite permease-like protein
LSLALLPSPAWAAGPANQPPLDLSPFWVLPFVLLLLSIAVLPLVAEHWWHKNRNKAVVAALFAIPVAAYLLAIGPATRHASTAALRHEVEQYFSFIILLWALYTVSGGIVLRGDIQGRPLTNASFLALGAVLANLIGTTGASVLLIRPVLRINSQRRNRAHLPVFFIFLVSNLGGLLTPLGDPPLFLGFLNGVDFFWTLSLWPQWLVANGVVLAVFFVWDSWAYQGEAPAELAADAQQVEPLRVHGLQNLLFLAGILAAVLLQSPQVGRGLQSWLNQFFACPDLTLHRPWGELTMIAMGLLALLLTPRANRRANGFSWGAIVEVAVLFAGIFVTMVPALELLKGHGAAWGKDLGLTEPAHYFWMTGLLSSFLDNAPTYLVFANMAAAGNELGWLTANKPAILAAISCGAVFMGANTYIGNGPNFMVKAIADSAGYKTPSFFGYMLYSGLVLLPTFALVTYLFFRN